MRHKFRWRLLFLYLFKGGNVKYKTRSESEEINKIKLAFLLCMADNKSRELLVKVVNCDEEYRFDRGFGCCQRRSPS